MKFSELFKIHFLRRLPAFLGAGLIAALFTLYYVGIIDFSFIDRPEAWKNNLSYLSGMVYGEDGEAAPPVSEDVGDDSTADNSASAEPENQEGSQKPAPQKPSKPQKGENVTPVVTVPTFKTVAEMKSEGYYLTNKPYDSTTVFAKLECDYDWPEAFSYSWKTYDTQVATTYTDGNETTVEDIRATGERAALELYMGYIIYDADKTLYLIGPDGSVICKYNDEAYIPAYTRDLNGRPLFYQKTSYTAKYPTVLGEKDENGNHKWDKTANLTVYDKIYYYLTPYGTFAKSDYNDVSDNRGLYFDYPSYYGTSDNNLDRYYYNTTKFFTDLKGKTEILNCLSWNYSKDKIKFAELKFDEEGFLVTDKEPAEGEERKTFASMFPYTMAYNYQGGYASVLMDIEWSYEHDVKNEEGKTEKKKFDVVTNEMRVVDKDGKIMFSSRKNHFSEYGWTAHEVYKKPLYKDIRSLGSYYFDHGLMRLRAQTFDCYLYAEYDETKIVTDEDILVRPTGEQFNIPQGYNLISYSDGILLLEKDGKYGYMNYLGSWIRDPEFPDARPFIEGVAAAQSKEGNWGMINTDGEFVIPCFYSYISDISSGTVAAYSESTGWTVYQKLTK